MAERSRTHTVAPEDDGAALSSLVRRTLGISWTAAKALCARGHVRVGTGVETDPGRRVRAGDLVTVEASSPRQDTPFARERLIHHDAHLVVVDKPSGVNTVPYEPGEKGTLVDLVTAALHRWRLAPAQAPLFVVHRLDRETSGALVFGRTWEAKRHLAGLFRAHTLERSYLALAHGHFARERTVETWLLEDRGDGLRGSARGPGEGRRAVTHLRPLAHAAREGGVTLVACTLETGRQHQIRIHLAEAGHPVVGEKVYVREFKTPRIDAPRVMLHARTLGFTHPARGEAVRFEARVPEDFLAVCARLGLTVP